MQWIKVEKVDKCRKKTADERLHIGSDHIAQRIADSHFTPQYRLENPPVPRNMQLEPTNICNYHCTFCASSKIKKTQYATMPPELFERLAVEAYQLGVREVGLYSRGESFLCPNLEDYVKRCSTIGFEYIYITTNGSLATSERVKKLIENGIHSIKFSVNAATRENYKSIHGHDNLELVTQHIKSADKIRKYTGSNVHLAISCVITELTTDEESAFIERFSDYVDTVVFTPARSHGGHMQSIARQHDDRTFCNIPFNMVNIISSGHLAACCVDFTEELVVADLRQVSLEDAWGCTRLRAIRKKHLSGNLKGLQCERCL